LPLDTDQSASSHQPIFATVCLFVYLSLVPLFWIPVCFWVHVSFFLFDVCVFVYSICLYLCPFVNVLYFIVSFCCFYPYFCPFNYFLCFGFCLYPFIYQFVNLLINVGLFIFCYLYVFFLVCLTVFVDFLFVSLSLFVSLFVCSRHNSGGECDIDRRVIGSNPFCENWNWFFFPKTIIWSTGWENVDLKAWQIFFFFFEIVR